MSRSPRRKAVIISKGPVIVQLRRSWAGDAVEPRIITSTMPRRTCGHGGSSPLPLEPHALMPSRVRSDEDLRISHRRIDDENRGGPPHQAGWKLTKP